MNSQADSHDEDKLPRSVTVNEGEMVSVDFSTHPNPATDGYDFLGWSTNEYGTYPEYSVDGQNVITLYWDVTLYPVYGEHISSNYLAINNNYGLSNILVEWHDDDKDRWKTSAEVITGSSYNFDYNPDRNYRISFSDGNFQDCVFSGTIGDDTYSNEPCVDAGNGIVAAPYGHDWLFTGICHLTVAEPSFENKLRIVNDSNITVEIYYEEDKTEYGNTFIYSGESKIVSIDPQYPYILRYANSGGENNSHTFNGTYQESLYDGDVGYYDWNIQPPKAVGSITEWRFYNNDGGTLTIRGGSPQPSGRTVTYDGEHQVGYGEYADNPIQYDGGEE